MARVGRNGIDLSQLDRVPESLSWPLQRNGVDPSSGSATCAAASRSPSSPRSSA